jgi:hypothetical protein
MPAEPMDTPPVVAEAAPEEPQAESRPEVEPMSPTTPLQTIAFGPLHSPAPPPIPDDDEPSISLNR